MQAVRIRQLVWLGAALRRLDRYRCQSHEGISSRRTGEIPSNLPPKSGDAETLRLIATDVTTGKYQGKQPPFGRLRTAADAILVTPTGIEPVFQP